MYHIVFLQLGEIGLDHPPLVVDNHGEFPTAEIPEPVHDQLGNGLFPHGNQRFGQNFGVRVQPGTQPARHHHHGNVGVFAVVHIQPVGEDNVGDDAPLVQDGQRVDAVFLQHIPGTAPLGDGQA